MRKAKLTHLLLLFTIWFLLFESVSFVAIEWTGLFGKYLLSGTPSAALSADEYKAYLRKRDNTLGWPSADIVLQRHAGVGNSRSNGVTLNDGGVLQGNLTMIQIYGDSYTFGEEVSDKETFPAQLEKIRGSTVLNFGVGGYGIDQMYLRYLQTKTTGAVHILAFVPGDYRRTLTRSYELLGGFGVRNPYSYKPRFEFKPGKGLELIPVPTSRFGDYVELQRFYRESRIPHETFNAGHNIWAVVVDEKSYFFTIVKLSGVIFLRQLNQLLNMNPGRATKPFYYSWRYGAEIEVKLRNLFQWLRIDYPEHMPSAIVLNEKILEAFVEDCKRGDGKCLILPLPYLSDFGSEIQSPIVRSLRRNPMLSTHLMELSDSCLESAFSRLGIARLEIKHQLAPKLHYSPASNNAIAQCIQDGLNPIRH